MLFYIRPSTAKKTGGTITEDSFNFTGSYLFESDEDGNWELALLESGTLIWNTLPGNVDLCLVGAGKDGGAGYFSGLQDGNYEYAGAYINSGPGGDSGRVLTETGVTLPGSCAVVIGTDGGETTLGDHTSANGTKRTGGTSAKMPQAYQQVGTVNTGGKDGVWPYETASDETMIPALQGHKVGASGGAGHANNNNKTSGGTLYPVYTDQHGGNATGGETDGGDGGTRSHHAGYDATGYGNGGGGGYGDGSGHLNGAGGQGSDGIALIRNSR